MHYSQINTVKSYKTVTKGCKTVTKMIYCKYFIQKFITRINLV